MSAKKTAVIFEGGGMRGIYTTGAADALIEKNVFANCVYGVSAGACHAISYLSKQKERSYHVNVDYCDRPDYFGLRCLLTEKSAFGWKLIFDTLPKKFPIDYQTLFSAYNNESAQSGKLVMGVTNALTGKEEYFTPKTEDEIITVSKASSSLPFACPPVDINGVPYFDGGIADSIPVQKALDDGADVLFIVLTQPKGYRKSQTKHAGMIKRFYKKHPLLAQAIIDRPTMYNKEVEHIEQLEKEGRAIVIRPDARITVGRTERDKEKLHTLYLAGKADALAALDSFIALAQ